MSVIFWKYHGTGNDFIMIDNRDESFHPGKETIAELCDRHFGIGADGLILLGMQKGLDFSMRYFNSDGNESSMCGNGGRCAVAFADYLSLIGDKTRFSAADGEHEAEILSREQGESLVRLHMSDVNGYEKSNDDYFIDTGSPHLIKLWEDLEALNIIEEGRRVRYSERFRSAGTNVDFIRLEGNVLEVRTYERGVEDETLSCGTGVTASAIAAAIMQGKEAGNYHIKTRGGNLKVSFVKKDNIFSQIWLEGPARLVFQGEI